MLTTLLILGAINGDFVERKGVEVPGENGWARFDNSFSMIIIYNNKNINQENTVLIKKTSNQFSLVNKSEKYRPRGNLSMNI